MPGGLPTGIGNPHQHHQHDCARLVRWETRMAHVMAATAACVHVLQLRGPSPTSCEVPVVSGQAPIELVLELPALVVLQAPWHRCSYRLLLYAR
jgi:hypothetical protein